MSIEINQTLDELIQINESLNLKLAIANAVIAASAGMKLKDGNWHPLNTNVGNKDYLLNLSSNP